jgi:hypothetical protein
MTQEEANTQRVAYSRVDRIAPNEAPVQPDVKENKGPRNHAVGKPTPAPSMWIRNVNDYHRRQPREYAVTRFG